MNPPELSGKKYKNKYLFYAYFIIPILGLLAVEVYSTLHANHYLSNIQDDLLYPYLFQHFSLNDIVVPSAHANTLKYPLFALQSVIPYNSVSLTIVNLTLAIGAVAWWVTLLMYIFGKKYLPIICTFLAAILFAGFIFHISFAETTIRNIEYPIGLSFIIVVNHFMNKNKTSRLQLYLAVVAFGLFALAVSGDHFMIYGFTVPILIVIAINWLQAKTANKKLLTALAITLGSTLCGLLFLKVIAHLGIVGLYSSTEFATKILPVSALGPSIAHATLQLLDLTGADIFGRELGLNTLLYFLNLFGLIFGIAGMFMIVRDSFKPLRSKLFEKNSFTISVLAFSFFVTYIAYIASNLVVVAQSNGTFTDASNARYITLMPLILVVGFIFFFTKVYPKRKEFYYIMLVVYAVAILFAIPTVKSDWKPWDMFANHSKTTITNIISAAKENNVKAIVTADSLGAPVRFWSNNTIQYVSITGCTDRFPYNTRRSWGIIPVENGNTALVIDKSGIGSSYWSGCTYKQIADFYGQPSKVVYSTNLQGSNPIQIWIYPTNVLEKLAPYPYNLSYIGR